MSGVSIYPNVFQYFLPNVCWDGTNILNLNSKPINLHRIKKKKRFLLLQLMWCVRFEVPRSCHARGSGNASERAPSDSDFILWSYLSITSTHAAQAAALISSIWIYVCVLSYVPRLQQLRNSTSYVSSRRNPCPIWKFLNTFGWWSSWEKDPMGKSCWLCTEREVSARLSSVGASLTKHFSIFLKLAAYLKYLQKCPWAPQTQFSF